MDKEFYVTNTEATLQDGNPEIHLFGRTPSGEPDSIIIEKYDPHFFVRPEATDDISPMDHDDLEGFAETDKVDIIEQEKLVKVIVKNPFKKHEVAELFDETWEADVDYTNRLRINEGIHTGVAAPSKRVTADEIEPVDIDSPERVVTFDIETDDRGQGFPDHGEARILSLVAHDNYNDEYTAFIDLDDELSEAFPEANLEAAESPADIGLEHIDKLNFYSKETEMLRDFYKYISETDPDLLTGWNSNGFDTPFVLRRGQKVGVNANRMARYGGEVGLNWRGDPYINGRTPYDLMSAWEDTKFTKVSGSLENAASMELDEGKIEHEDYGFYELYSENTTKFLNYNAKDTHLTIRVNEAANVLGFKKALRDTIGLDYEDTHDNKDFITMMVRRKLHEEGYAGPTAVKPDDPGSFDGAFVFPPFKGLKTNIVGIDLASLYPNTLWMLNASPDTKMGKIGRDFKQQWVDRIRAEGYELAVSSNGVVFTLEYDGIFRELVDEALTIKEKAGRKKQDGSLSEEEQEEWAEEYAVRKTIVNSIYGVLGWIRFFLYDKDIASAVTLTGQEVIKTTAEYVNSTPWAEVAYGDTDSNYIELPSTWSQEKCLEEAQNICDNLNESVYPELAADLGLNTEVEGIDLPTRFEIELEMFASTFFQSGKKKFYAYVKTWKEGMDFDARLKGGKGKVSISGYPCVKANTAPITAEVQRKTLTAIVRDADQDEIRQIIIDAVESIDPNDPDFDHIGVPSGLGQEMGEYAWTNGTPQDAAPRAAHFGNLFVPGVHFGKGETVKRVYLTGTNLEYQNRTYNVDVIGFDRASQLEPILDDLTVNIPKMQDTVIRNPMVDILDSVGIDVDAAMKGQSQSGLSAYV